MKPTESSRSSVSGEHPPQADRYRVFMAWGPEVNSLDEAFRGHITSNGHL